MLKKFTQSKVNQNLSETNVRKQWHDKKTNDVWVYVDVPKSIIEQKTSETIEKWKKHHSTKIIVVISEEIDSNSVNFSVTKRIIEDKLFTEGYQVMNLTDEQKIMIFSRETNEQRKFVKSLGADIFVVGNAESNLSSIDSAGNNYSLANANIKAIRTSDGEVISGKNIIDMKGFGVNPSKSGKNAIRKIAIEIAEKLEEILNKNY